MSKQRWFKPKVESGWKKNMAAGQRRGKALRAHKGDELATARSLQALANVTRDSETRRVARKDALFFYDKHKRQK